MCLILFAIDSHPRYRLVVAANRDEYHRRPSTPAGFWPDAPQVFGGRDQERGGSWLGLTTRGKLAMVTNVRMQEEAKPRQPSRGLLVSDYLTGGKDPADYLAELASAPDVWQGFNLLAGLGSQLYYWSNRGSVPRRLGAGVYGLSNHLLDTPWPKVSGGKDALTGILARSADEPALFTELLQLLTDRQPVADELLPETGFGLDWERCLAPRFICSPDYGTRCSTVVLIDDRNQVSLIERRFSAAGELSGETIEHFRAS
jgi:uncharacterized protein with NRDE domain